MKYNFGDIVILKERAHLGEAAVVARNKNGLFALEFARPNAELHDCGGLTDYHCGYWASERELELLDTACGMEEFLTEAAAEASEPGEPERKAASVPSWSLMLNACGGEVHGMFIHEETGPVFHAAQADGRVLEDILRAVYEILLAEGNGAML